MQSEPEAVKKAIVDYTFTIPSSPGGTCTAKIVVLATPGHYRCNGAGPFPGYAIAGGALTYTLNGNSNTLPFIAHSQGGPGFQILWADGSGVPGGSSHGLATMGPYLGGGGPSLSWVSGSGFNLNLMTVQYTLNLSSCKGWPPA